MKLRMFVLGMALALSGILYGADHPVYQQELSVLVKKTEIKKVSNLLLKDTSKENKLHLQ